MVNKYTFLTGERVEIIAETQEEAEAMLARGEYAGSTTESRLLIIGYDMTEEGKIYRTYYPSVETNN